jgi:hypothetical protein
MRADSMASSVMTMEAIVAATRAGSRRGYPQIRTTVFGRRTARGACRATMRCPGPAAQVGLLRSLSPRGIPRRRMQSLVVQLDLLEREMSDDTEP